jgi:hypothetical protein
VTAIVVCVSQQVFTMMCQLPIDFVILSFPTFSSFLFLKKKKKKRKEGGKEHSPPSEQVGLVSALACLLAAVCRAVWCCFGVVVFEYFLLCTIGDVRNA